MRTQLLCALLLVAVMGLLVGCSPKKKAPSVVITEVKIVLVQEKDSLMRWGGMGCTTIEYTNGVRRQIGGIYGNVGDTFKLPTDPVWLQ
jgi:hypothetical protein